MNRRQKIIVSITGIFIVLLALVGLTYAFFLTRITGNGNPKSISVTTAKLELVYGNDDGSIIGNNEVIEPGKKFTTKTFTVTNNGNAVVDDYAVILEDVSTTYANTFMDGENEIAAGTPTSFKRPEDFKIKITCSSKKQGETSSTECNGMSGTLPLMKSATLDETYITNGILVQNSIEVGEVQTYSVELEYEEAKTNQSADMNKRLEGKFNIIDTKNTVDMTGTVSEYELGDKVVTNSRRRVSQINSDGTYKIIGLEAGIHSIKINDTEISKISIKKGETAGVGETTYEGVTIPQITITDESRIATIDISNTDINVDDEITENVTFKEGTLAYEIINNAKLALEENNTTKTIYRANPISTIGNSAESGERTLSEITENGKKSYYFRGNVYDNYVEYAGMCWRVVRIESDGSVKLILEAGNATCGAMPLSHNYFKVIGSGNYGYKVKDNIMAEPDFFSGSENSMKYILDEWLKNNISLSKQELLKEDTWCLGYSDEYRYGYLDNKYKLISQSYINEQYNQVLNSIGKEEPYMFTYYYNDFVKLQENKLNNLDCDNQQVLTSKIGGITASEVVLAGVGESNWDGVKNYSYLTQHIGETEETFFPTITPSYFDFFPDEQTEDVPIPFYASVYAYFFSEHGYDHYGLVSGTFPIMDSYSIRPMITLKNDIKVKNLFEFDSHESVCVECFEGRYYYTVEE